VIEAKLLVGRYLSLVTAPTRPLRGANPVVAPPIFDPLVCPPLNMQESTRFAGAMGGHFGQRASQVVAGANANPAKIHRNFKWLPYYEGDISTTPQDMDVLTGPMSGCPLVRFMQGGQIVVGHIGTVLGQAAFNAAVTALWNGFALAHPGDVLGGFNPFGAGVPLPPPANGAGDSVARIWGLITTAGVFYSVQVYQQLHQANYYRVAAVHQVPSMTLHQLQNL
jgi:hypothetical protein